VIDVTVHGAEGRMGRLVTELLAATPDVRLAALVTEPGRGRPVGTFHPGLPLTGQEGLAAAHPPGGVIVDFSLAGALEGLLAGAAATRAPLVIGTTGFTPTQQAALAAYARDHAVVHAANFSAGIPALQMALELLARILPAGFGAEQVETHHTQKRDAPSGTARQLAGAWEAVRGDGPVPVHAQRLGGITGEHSWTLADAEETLVLTHRAHSRQAFLRGVAPAVRFAAVSGPGLFGMADVLASGR
jgi:4-hydroxy-tetrahydrodipicolinate reductase